MNADLRILREEACPPHPMNYHDLACLFPMLGNEALAELTEDIRRNGVREPIVLFEGKILDGRNRYHAAREVGATYPVAEYVGSDPLGYVVSLNLQRRHLSESQRAMVAAKLAKLPPGRPSETAPIEAVSQSRAADMLNVGRSAVQRAHVVQERATPELVTAVELGAVSVSAAAEVAKLPEPDQAEIVEIGPEAVKEAAAELRAGADAEHVRKVVIEGAAAGLRPERKPQVKNPEYRPSPDFDAMSALTGSCRRVNEIMAERGVEAVMAGFLDAAMLARNLPDIIACRDNLNLILERSHAEQAAA